MQTTNPFRILTLTYQGAIAGSTMSVSYLCRGLAEKGHKVVLACKKDSLYNKLLSGTDVQIEYLPFSSKWDRTTMRMIRDIVEKENIQIINVQASKDRYNSIFARWIYKLPVKLVHTRRQIPLSVGGLQSWFYTKGTDQIVAVSKGVKEALVKKGIPSKHITVIHNGTPIEKYSVINDKQVDLLRKKYNIKPTDIVIGCVSRCKKQEQIIQALKHIKQPHTVFFVGIHAKDIEKKIDPYCKPHTIHYCGSIEPTEALNYYKLFNQFILPSISEGLSQSLLEAMFLGVPVIATNAAGNPDLITDGENGLLFEDKDSKGLADKINLLIEDKDLSQKLSENGKQTAHENFSIKKTIENYEVFFNNLINNNL